MKQKLKQVLKAVLAFPSIQIKSISKSLEYRQKLSKFRADQNKLQASGSKYENLSFAQLQLTLDVQGRNNCIKIGNNVRGSLAIKIRGSSHKIVIGDDVAFNKPSTIDAASNTTAIEIQDSVRSMGSRFQTGEPDTKIIVGRSSLLADSTVLLCTDFHSIVEVDTSKRINFASHIILEEHVWLGLDVMVLKNVTIGKDSIVAAKSLVTRDIPCNSISMGVPAKVMKQGVTWDKQLLDRNS